MTLTSDSRTGVVRVEHTAEDIGEVDKSAITAITLERKREGIDEWRTLCTIAVSDGTDDEQVWIVYEDRTVCAHYQYMYRNVVWVGQEPVYGSIQYFTTDIDGIVLSDADTSIVFLANASYTHKQNFNMTYVHPFYSRYPHSVQNGESNYSTGTVKGLVNSLSKFSITYEQPTISMPSYSSDELSNGNGLGYIPSQSILGTISPVCGVSMAYAPAVEPVVEFLSNGKPKLLRTHDGHGWYVQIDGNSISTDTEQGFYGLSAVSFSWTEIAAPPVVLEL